MFSFNLIQTAASGPLKTSFITLQDLVSTDTRCCNELLNSQLQIPTDSAFQYAPTELEVEVAQEIFQDVQHLCHLRKKKHSMTTFFQFWKQLQQVG